VVANMKANSDCVTLAEKTWMTSLEFGLHSSRSVEAFHT
jgi:hypothetical protein